MAALRGRCPKPLDDSGICELMTVYYIIFRRHVQLVPGSILRESHTEENEVMLVKSDAARADNLGISRKDYEGRQGKLRKLSLTPTPTHRHEF